RRGGPGLGRRGRRRQLRRAPRRHGLGRLCRGGRLRGGRAVAHGRRGRRGDPAGTPPLNPAARILGAGPVTARARRRPGGPAPRRAGPDPKESVVDSAPIPSGSAVGTAAGPAAAPAVGPSVAPASADGGPITLDLAIDRDSATPLYLQLAGGIEEAIRSGVLSPGSRLENELALSKRLRLSRPTVRQGIQEL